MDFKVCLFLSISIIIIECSVLDFWESTIIKYTIGLVLLILTYISINKCSSIGEDIQPFNKAVLITGCDSGFGHNLAKRLDSGGFHVFASCLFPDGEGANNLKKTCSSHLKVLPLDISKNESVENALIYVKENLGSNVLWAIVNNAGIGQGLSVDFSTIQTFKDTFDVNVLGTVRVTKAFLPLLKKCKGRVINVASIIGRIPTTNGCAYIMSKYAIVAFSECLRLEMKPWGIRVITIEPEGFRTQITNYENLSRSFDDALKKADKDILSSYGQDYIEGTKKFLHKYTESCSDKINIVVDAMESAISKRNPNHVYKPARNLLCFVALFVLQILPTGLYEKTFMICQKIMGYPSLNVEKKVS